MHTLPATGFQVYGSLPATDHIACAHMWSLGAVNNTGQIRRLHWAPGQEVQDLQLHVIMVLV